MSRAPQPEGDPMRNKVVTLEAKQETAGSMPGSLILSNGLSMPAGLSGLKPELPYSSYDADPALRISVLDRISVSPLHLKTSLAEDDDDTSSKRTGRIFHTLVLQPELVEKTIVVVDATTRTTNAYKAAVLQYPDKDIVLQHEFDELCRMRDGFHTKALNRSLLKDALLEASCFWVDPIAGLRCKARPDVLASSHLVDIKTTRAIRYFRQDAEAYGYIRQAAWYLDGVRAVSGKRIDKFIFIAVEKKAPFDSQVFELGPKTLARARAENDENLAKYNACLRANEWPGYPEIIQELAP
jgi:hypothetical protein